MVKADGCRLVQSGPGAVDVPPSGNFTVDLAIPDGWPTGDVKLMGVTPMRVGVSVFDSLQDERVGDRGLIFIYVPRLWDRRTWFT